MFSSIIEKKQALILFFIEIILIILIGILLSYGLEEHSDLPRNYTRITDKRRMKQLDDYSMRLYPMYQDIHVMIWIGFGFLMTFLKRYSQSAIGLTFLLGAIFVQVALICNGVMDIKMRNKAYLSLESLLNADVAVAAPLISMGALLGKVTYIQLVLIGTVELIIFTVNKYIGEHLFMVIDTGDSMFVHVFGAYFGLAISFVFGVKGKSNEPVHHLEEASYQSDVFAMIGTVFLWLFWPSFNSASLMGNNQQRAVINTVLSISASCIIAFAISALISKNNKFNMIHVQNSTLAGGVAIGTAAGMMCEPVGALIVGSLSGAISVLGYKYITPIMQKRFRIHDTCGIHNLHGMPGVLAAIFGALTAILTTETSLYEISSGLGRTGYQQAGYQVLALVVTFATSVISGLITGLIIYTLIYGWIAKEQQFDDKAVWELKKSQESFEKTQQNDQIAMNNI